MRDAYAAGEVHIGWATLDMLPLFIDSFAKDPKVQNISELFTVQMIVNFLKSKGV